MTSIGATTSQCIAQIADKVGSLTVVPWRHEFVGLPKCVAQGVYQEIAFASRARPRDGPVSASSRAT